jgi:hypothetical protein
MNRIERTADEIIIREHADSTGYRFPIPRSLDALFGWQRQLASKPWITKDDLVEVARLAAVEAGYGGGRLR